MFDDDEEVQFQFQPEASTDKTPSYKWTWHNFWANVFRGIGGSIAAFAGIFTGIGDDLVAHSNFREEEREFSRRAGLEIEALTKQPVEK